ncbi:competence/damage-inducible protein A [Acidiferrimicrobium sp. IK]|uniref:competence/damage-inducible protein A n=1 Tax=Acidiferrimicrobium sp. IK TaxID=2871700 RepID=UPI0021CB7026|nr:competence/damage-inducible protein A [Acidiferrimicrobium sp. IK]MCU4183724.1 competence/damage-inducible protein A [Acidiferrimicrobium sp. IK]
MRVEVVAVGTELLLGYVIDTNSAWIGEQLAAHGLDCVMAVKVGDNRARITAALRAALGRADAVICCGGLGPTQDDITREAIAEVMGVGLERDKDVEQRIEEMFARWRHPMTDNNRRQADVPAGATVIPQVRGTAPGLICPVTGPVAGEAARVIYAVPGVPGEMREMIERAVLPDLLARSGDRSVIASRTLRTWGLGESTVADILAPRLDALERVGNPAIAFLASGAEGIKVRITAKVTAEADEGSEGLLHAEAAALLDGEEAEVRALLGDRVFAVDEQTMESVVGDALLAGGLTLAVAESLTGGLLGSRLTDVPGASRWFRGGVVSYATDVKRDVLGVPEGPVISSRTAEAMAAGAARVLGADVGLAVTGVAGPDEQEGQPVGTVWVGSWLEGSTAAARLSLPGGRPEVRALTVISALDHLRRRLLGLPADQPRPTAG